MKNNILILCFILITTQLAAHDSFRMFHFLWSEPIYGEGNAPEHIYYKFIQNNTSNVFFYSLARTVDDSGYPVTRIMIIPVNSNDALLLIIPDHWAVIYQWNLSFQSNLRLFEYGNLGGYWSTENIDSTDGAELTSYLRYQYNYNYSLILKNSLLFFLNDILPDVRVIINTRSVDAPSYIRNLNNNE
ncbi:MAG: hypothetical protein LBB89_13195 [Treponema sp.]|jgi:hypothetical protein|nr:hypothetical protein [Treponema sp.]